MNSKERALTAFSHKEPDRVPIFELSIDNPTAEFVLGRPNLCGFGGKARGFLQNKAVLEGKYYEYHKNRIEDKVELWKKLELDVFPGVFPIPKQPSIPDQISEYEWKFSDPNSGFWGIYEYSEESDVYDQVNSSLKEGGLAELEKLTDYLEKQEFDPDLWDFSLVDSVIDGLGSEFMVLGEADVEIGSTFDWAETFLIGLIETPDLIHRYLDARLKPALKMTEMLLERGVHGIHGGYDWASNKGPVFSPRHFRQFVFPRLKQITDLCHRFGVPYVKHTDGNVNVLLKDMIDAGVDGFQAIEPRAGMNIAQIKKDYGDQLTLIGNVDCSTVLVNGPEEAVREETKNIIQVAASGGGFLLSSSNSIHSGVKPEYYLAMLNTAREEGKYPILKKNGEI
ncbi:MAG: uroporphyrinogen decarboxylase family protein [Anaerolineaceae bacterium]